MGTILLESFEDYPDIKHFIEFSPILSKERRIKFVHYMESRLNGLITNPQIEFDSGFEKGLYEQFESVLSNKELLEMCQLYPEVGRDVGVEFIKEMTKAIRKGVYSHPFEEEEIKFENYQQKKQMTFLRDYHMLEKYLAGIYTKDEINLPFYSRASNELKSINNRFSSLNKKKATPSPIKPKGAKISTKTEKIFQEINTKTELELKVQGFKQELLTDWNGNLEKKTLNYFLQEIDTGREAACKILYANIEKFKKLMQILQPFEQELGRLWDLSKGNWTAIGFDILSHYATLLEQQEAIKNLAEMLGRLHDCEKELEEQEIDVEKILYSTTIDHAQKSEIVSIHESDDLQYCIPQELVLLGSPESELLFYLKYAEKKLLTYQLINRARIAEKQLERTQGWLPSKKKKGPIIICVDTSGSMYGTPETIAKTLCFAILRIALLENRQCYLISFSTAIKTIELTDFNQSYVSMIQFLSHSFHGGTDATPALQEALKQIKNKKYEKADVLMISDFIMDRIDKQTETEITQAKKGKTKFHSLIISQTANPSALEIFDNSWLYDPTDKKILKKVVENFRSEI